MLADFLRLISRRAPADYERGFVRKVAVREPRRRNPRVERLLAVGWALIAVKCAALAWAYHLRWLPINPAWVIVPTLVFASLCTAVYAWWE
jgi:hypothetical protein